MNARFAFVLAVILALALGGTGGYFAGRGSVEDSHPRRLAANVCAPEDGGSEGVKPGVTNNNQPGNTDNTKPETKPTDTNASQPSLKSAIEAVKVDAPPKGTGKITGTVRKSDGSPLPGVTVTAYPQNQPKTGPRKDKPTIEEEVEATIRRRRYQDATSCIAKTDAEGKYVVEGLREEQHYVTAELPGFEIQAADWRAMQNARPGAVIDFTAKPVGKAIVDVLMPDGSRPEKAYVSWTQRSGNGGASSYGQDWSPADREYEREFGAWEVRAYTGDAQEFASETVAVSIESGKEPPSVTLTVKERPGIKGKLLLPSGDTGADIWVNAVFYDGDPPDEAKFIKRASMGGGYYRSGEGGFGGYVEVGNSNYGQSNYAFLDLKPGKYLLGAVRGQKLIASVTVLVGAAIVVQDLAIPEMQTGDIVIVHVLGPDGKPAPECTLSSGYRQGQALYGGSQGNKRPDGSYWVAHAPQPEGVDGGSFVVTVYTAAWGTVETPYEKKAVSELTVKFAEPASLIVTVNGLENHPYAEHLSVAILKEGDQNQPYNNEPPANRKDWTFGPLTPGKYEIRLIARTDDEYWGNTTVASQTINLNSGKNTANIAAPQLYKLKVTMKAKGEVGLYLQKQGEETQGGMYVQTDKNGVTEFAPLGAGKYNITNYSDGTVMQVSVPEQLEVTFEATKINAWRIDVKDNNGYAATLGLLSGDLVVSINGTEFENQAQMWMLLQNAEDKANVKFGIQRGAARLEITADYMKLFDPSKAGCSLTPTAR